MVLVGGAGGTNDVGGEEKDKEQGEKEPSPDGSRCGGSHERRSGSVGCRSLYIYMLLGWFSKIRNAEKN